MNRPEPIELENNLGPDAVTGEINRVPWMAYDVDEMDLYIAEKDAEIAELKKKLMPCLNGDCILTCEVVEKYGKENAELKQKLEDVQATAYAESVDAGMENRKLKRALWLAREWRAWCEGKVWFFIENTKPRDIYHLSLTNRIHRTPNEWITYWYKAEQLCKKKAEAYK